MKVNFICYQIDFRVVTKKFKEFEENNLLSSYFMFSVSCLAFPSWFLQ